MNSINTHNKPKNIRKKVKNVNLAFLQAYSNGTYFQNRLWNLLLTFRNLFLVEPIFKRSEPILEFKGSIWYVQKEHPNMVTQVDMILQNWWEFKH